MTKKFINYFLILCTIMLILSGCTKKEKNNQAEEKIYQEIKKLRLQENKRGC